jgi:hypothetical protein
VHEASQAAQVVPSRKFPSVHPEHVVASVVAVQPLHFESQATQFVVEGVKRAFAAQTEHSVAAGPVHVVHNGSQALQVLSVESGY